MNRPIVIATIGTILGIIWGLYFKTSTILFLLVICTFVLIINFKPQYRISRYLKVIIKPNIMILFICSAIISLFYTSFRNNLYESITEEENYEAIGEIKSNAKANKYTYSYEININGKLYMIYIKSKNGAKEFEYGDIINITGSLELPEEARNYEGFSQRNYYKSKGIYGIIYAKTIKKINKRMSIGKIGSIIRESIKKNISKYLSENNANILQGILIGDKSKISDDILEQFKQSSLIHILCVSRSTCRIYFALATKITKRIWKKKEIYLIIICNCHIIFNNRFFSISNKSMCYGSNCNYCKTFI